jgi:solute carrier family 25 protein 16
MYVSLPPRFPIYSLKGVDFVVVDAYACTRNELASILCRCYIGYVPFLRCTLFVAVHLFPRKGAISVFFTYPLELLRVRMAFDTIHSSASGKPVRPSCLRTARLIYAEGSPQLQRSVAPMTRELFHVCPLLKFYRGFSVSLAGIVPYAGTAFLTWGYLRSIFIPVGPDGRRPRATPLADLGIGALSGALAQTVSYPFEVVRRRMQVGGLTSPGRWLHWGETVRGIWARGGARGFFIGLSIGYLKIVPMNAVSFAVWQSMKRLLDP